MGDTPTYHIPYPDPTDPADVPADMQATALATEAVLSAFKTDTDADLGNMQDQITGAVGSLAQLGHVLLAADAAAINFAAIPQTYTHLMLLVNARITAAGTAGYVVLRINGVATGYHDVGLNASNNVAAGSSAIGATGAAALLASSAGAPAGYYGRGLVLIPNYPAPRPPGWMAISHALGAATAAGMFLHLRGGTMNAAGPVTALSLSSQSLNVAAGSMATLYGIKGA